MTVSHCPYKEIHFEPFFGCIDSLVVFGLLWDIFAGDLAPVRFERPRLPRGGDKAAASDSCRGLRSPYASEFLGLFLGGWVFLRFGTRNSDKLVWDWCFSVFFLGGEWRLSVCVSFWSLGYPNLTHCHLKVSQPLTTQHPAGVPTSEAQAL